MMPQVQAAKNELDHFEKQLEQQANVVSEESMQKAKELSQNSIRMLANLENSYRRQGQDTEVCFRDMREVLHAIPTMGFEKLNKCIEKKAAKPAHTIDKVKQSFNKVSATVLRFRRALKMCRGDRKCPKKIFLQASLASIYYPAKMKLDSDIVKDQIIKSSLEMQRCYTEVIEKLQIDSLGKISNAVVTCAASAYF